LVSGFIHDSLFMTHNSIILSADDFGKSEIANKNILKLIKLGKIQRVSIMVDGNVSKKEIDKLLKSKIKLDIHLGLPQNNKNFPNSNKGVLFRTARFVMFYLTGRISKKKIEADWENQIVKFKKIFRKAPDGLNSHEHVHFFPLFFKIALKLCEKHKIPYIRLGKGRDVKSRVSTKAIAAILSILRQINKKYFYQYLPCRDGIYFISTSDYMLSLDWLDNLEKLPEKLPAPCHDDTWPSGTIEIVCHPEREKEYKQLKTYALR